MTPFSFPLTPKGELIIETWSDANGSVQLTFDGDHPSIVMQRPGHETQTYWDAFNSGSLQGLLRELDPGGSFQDAADLRPLIEQATALDSKIRAVNQGAGGYVFLEYRPHIKGMIRDVTDNYDWGWRAQYPGLLSVEETWFYDDSRRSHIASAQGHIEARAISERAIFEPDTPETLIDDCNNDLAGFEQTTDYFRPTSPAWESAPATDEEVRELLLGEKTYDQYIDTWWDHLRSNEEF